MTFPIRIIKYLFTFKLNMRLYNPATETRSLVTRAGDDPLPSLHLCTLSHAALVASPALVFVVAPLPPTVIRFQTCDHLALTLFVAPVPLNIRLVLCFQSTDVDLEPSEHHLSTSFLWHCQTCPAIYLRGSRVLIFKLPRINTPLYYVFDELQS